MIRVGTCPISNNNNFNFVDLQTFKEEITISDSDSSYVDVCDDEMVGRKSRSSVIEEINLDSDNDLLIDVCDSDLEELSDVFKAENASTDTTLQSTSTMVSSANTTRTQSMDVTMIQSTDFFDKDDSQLNLHNISGAAKDEMNNKKKRKKIFSTKNLYAYYCGGCDRYIKKVSGKKKTKCDVCKKKLGYRCLNCPNEYSSYGGIYIHLKEKDCFRPLKSDAGNVSNISKGGETSNLPLPRCSSCSKQLESSCNGGENNVRKVTVFCKKESESTTSSSNKQLCPKCGESLVNEIGHCDGKECFQCFTCDFKSCHKSTLEQLHIESLHIEAKLQARLLQTREDASREGTGPVSNVLMGRVHLHCNKVCERRATDSNVKTSVRPNCEGCDSPLHYICAICKKQYTNASSLYKHLQFECNVQPKFKCNSCDYRAKQKGNLQAHIERKHSAKRCRGCGKIFDNVISCRKHQLSECKIWYNCRYCKFTSKFISRFKEHVRLEHKSKYQCTNCGKKYSNLSSLQTHMSATCGQVTKFECDICAHLTLSKGALACHTKYVHQF